MIGDALTKAITQVNRSLEGHEAAYGDPALVAWIKSTVAEMAALRDYMAEDGSEEFARRHAAADADSPERQLLDAIEADPRYRV